MKPLYISKSKYCSAVQCPKMLWMHKFKKELFNESVLNEAVMAKGKEVGCIAMGMFGEYTEVEYTSSKQMIDTTSELIEKDTPIICEASFSYNGLFCRVDILKRNGDSFDIYEVKSSTEVKDIYLHDIGFQNFVLSNLGFNVRNVYIVHINNSYVRQGALELDKLFTIVDVTDEANSLYDDVKSRIKYLTEYIAQAGEPEKDISIACVDPYKCGYWGHCAKHLPTPNIFDIKRIGKRGFEYYQDGIVSFSDALKNIKLSEIQETQVSTELLDKPPYIDADAISDFLYTLSFPLYFLDFETFQQAVPQFYGISPYDQIPFQYSLHYFIREDSVLIHKEFLAKAGTDPRRQLAQRLVKDIPLDVCTTAYNMGFEKGVIKKLASQFPDLSEHLMNIHDNIKDLMIPFQKQQYYSKAMKGSYSIKKVLPALFPDSKQLDYNKLEGVQNGEDAMTAFALLAEKTEKEKLKIRTQLLKYCELDTYAMVKLWEKLREVSG
jgi:hypothetical protein